MSLEAKIEVLTAAVDRLTAVLQSAGIPTTSADTQDAAAASTAGTTRKPRSPKKDEQTAAVGATTGSPASNTAEFPSVNDGRTKSVKLRSGDPEGTRYFHIAAHNTVAAIKPGEPIPSLPGMAEIDGEEYDALKAKYSPAPSTQGAATTGAAASPASASPSASTASASTSVAAATSPATVDGPGIVEKCKALHARDGNEGLKKVLEHFKVARVGELAADTARHADIAKFVDGLLNPQAAPDLF